MPTVHSVLNHFRCEDPIKQTWRCKFCDKAIAGGSNRRKLEHLLAMGTSIRACVERAKLSTDEVNLLREELANMDAEALRRRRREQSRRAAIKDLDIGKRKLQGKLDTPSWSKDRVGRLTWNTAECSLLQHVRQASWTQSSSLPFSRHSSDMCHQHASPSWVLCLIIFTQTRRGRSRPSAISLTAIPSAACPWMPGNPHPPPHPELYAGL